jgi:phage head maturation protease
MSTLTVQGYGLVWCAVAVVDDGIEESIAPGAVDPSAIRNIELLFGVHDGPSYAGTADGSMSCWVDGHGLAFEAALNPAIESHRAVARSVARGDVQHASVNFTSMRRGPDGVVVNGVIDHIAITAVPAYVDTAAWLKEVPLAERTHHQRAASRVWLMGKWDRERVRSGRGTARGSLLGGSPSPFEKRSVPASVISLMASAAWREVAAMRGL